MKSKISNGKFSNKVRKDVRYYASSMHLTATDDEDAFEIAAIANILFYDDGSDEVAAAKEAIAKVALKCAERFKLANDR